MNTNDYPTDDELETIKSWDFTKQPIEDFLDLIESIWNWADIGYYQLNGKRVLKLQLHTGGWSGNEDIIGAIQDNLTFWMLCWQKSIRGGHYYFRIPKQKWRGRETLEKVEKVEKDE